MPSLRILSLGGDGIGPEVIDVALRGLDEVARSVGLAIDITEDLLHGAAWETHGSFCTDETVARAKDADAILVGRVRA